MCAYGCWLGYKKNRKNLRLHFIESVAFETVNSSEDVNLLVYYVTLVAANEASDPSHSLALFL